MKPEWADIKSDYVETAMTLADLQAKWQVPRGTLSARATREKWHQEKQQFAANLEHIRREKVLADRSAEESQFRGNVMKIASWQLVAIARQMQDTKIDAAKLLKLANALETLQRIGGTAFEV